MIDPRIVALLHSAASAQQRGDGNGALKHLQAVVALDPAHPQALNSLGVAAITRGDAGAAVDLLVRAAAADPGAAPVWMNLAKAQRLAGDDSGERKSLERVLAIDARDFMGLVRMAELHERTGEDARANEKWLAVLGLAAGIPSPVPAMVRMLEHATKFVNARAQAFSDAIDAQLDAARAGLAQEDRRRFDAAIANVMGRRKIYANQCAGLFYPFLPAEEFFPRALFPWFKAFEAQTAAIRAELEALLQTSDAAIRPYVAQAPGTPDNPWTPLDNSPAWSAYYLWRYGVKQDEACAACPATAAALAAVPDASDLPGRAPTAFFSILRPGARIPPHTGVSNTRTIVHLPLIVPEECGFRVGGETREWREGEAFGFDDTIEHEAWNESGSLRAVLILDVWNPYLTHVERGLLRTYYRAADESGLNPA